MVLSQWNTSKTHRSPVNASDLHGMERYNNIDCNFVIKTTPLNLLNGRIYGITNEYIYNNQPPRIYRTPVSTITQTAETKSSRTSSSATGFGQRTNPKVGSSHEIGSYSLQQISEENLETDSTDKKEDKIDGCFKCLSLVMILVAIIIAATVAIILVKYVILPDNGSSGVVKRPMKSLQITIAFNVGYPQQRVFYRNDYVYKAIMPLLGQLYDNRNVFSLETYADSDERTNFTKFTKNSGDCLDLLNELTKRSIVSPNPNQLSAVFQYNDLTVVKELPNNCTHVYIFFTPMLDDYSSTQLYSKDSHEAVAEMNKIISKQSKVILISKKENFPVGSSAIVKIDSEQPVEEIASQIIRHCLKSEQE